MINHDSKENYHPILDGIKIKTLVHGSATLMTRFLLARGSVLPAHAHPYEQTGYLLSGRIVLHIGNDTHEMRPGDSWCIPSDVEHRADILEESAALEIFSPAREDYLKYLDVNAVTQEPLS